MTESSDRANRLADAANAAAGGKIEVLVKRPCGTDT